MVRELDAIENCAAVAVPDPVRGEEVKVYVQLKHGITRSAIPPDAIVAHCRTRLAAFKAPRFIAYRDGFPRTFSEQLKREAQADAPGRQDPSPLRRTPNPIGGRRLPGWTGSLPQMA